MPFLLALLALAMPRVVIVLLVIFSDYIGRAFESDLLPFVGFLLLPFTTLAYAFSINTHGSIEGIYIAVIVFAVLLDLGVIRKWFWKKDR